MASPVVPRPWADALRPPPAPTTIDPAETTFRFFFVDLEYTMQFAPRGGRSRSGAVPVVYLYGKTLHGHSVVLAVNHYLPYFYVDAPPHFDPGAVDEYRAALEGHIARYCTNDRVTRRSNGTGDVVARVEHVRAGVFYGYDAAERPKLKVYCHDPQHVKSVAAVAKQGGFVVRGVDVPCARRVYESNMPYLLQFLVDVELKGCEWVLMRAGAYTHMRNAAEFHVDASMCFAMDVARFAVYHCAEDDHAIPPLRQLFFDIECNVPMGDVLDPCNGPVIQIASHIYELGRDDPLEVQCMTLRTCGSVAGARVLEFAERIDDAVAQHELREYLQREVSALFAHCSAWEQERYGARLTFDQREYTPLEVQEIRMLFAWRALVLDADVDIVGGYNSVGFDMWFVLDRAEALGVGPLMQCMSRRRSCVSKPRNQNFSSKQSGEGKQFMTADIPGLVQLDVLVQIQSMFKFRSFKLNAVASHFLGDQKEDMPYNMIGPCFDGSDMDRRRLVTYCIKDALLPYQLAVKLNLVVGLIEGVRVRGVPMQWLIMRGQGVSVISGIKRYSNKRNLLWPVLDTDKGDDEQFQGATVLEPVRGYYTDPVVVQDFKGLYPSIIRAHNLCYSTLISAEQAAAMPPGDYTHTPAGAYFVRAHVRVGVLPQLLEDWTNERDRVKRCMKTEDNAFKRAVLDGRQLGLKVSSNSVYGFTGARIGKLPCLAISCSVTAFGREMIDTCKRVVEENCRVANGWPGDAVTLYGDTDSVMVRFGGTCTTVRDAFEWGAKLEVLLNQQFIAPIEMEMEKVYMPWLLFNKKRYAGVMYEDARAPDKMSKIDVKGIESKRRDNCLLVSQTQQRALDYLLIDRDPAAAERLVRRVVSDLRQNKVDMSKLVITKEYARSVYKVKAAHVELVERIRARDPGAVPKLGDRVPYVMVKGDKRARGYEKSEDPLYAMQHGLPIDDEWYLQNQLLKPLRMVCLPVLGEKRTHELFTGEHTRKRVKPTPSKALGGIMRFAVKRPSCVHCRAIIHNADAAVSVSRAASFEVAGFRVPMDVVVARAIEAEDAPESPVLCSTCARDTALVHEQQRTVRALESETHQCWSYCQTCQSDRFSELMCTAVSCPIFYKRVRVRHDLEEQRARLQAMEAFSW